MLSAVTNGAHIFFFLSIGKIAVDDQKFAVSVFRNKIKKKKVFRCFGVSLFRGLARSDFSSYIFFNFVREIVTTAVNIIWYIWVQTTLRH